MDNFYSSISLFEYLSTEWYWGLWNSLWQQEASNTYEGCQDVVVNCQDFGPFMKGQSKRGSQVAMKSIAQVQYNN
jgi:hypothetical protein